MSDRIEDSFEMTELSEASEIPEDQEFSLMTYHVITTQRAENLMEEYLSYIVLKKRNMQAADAISIDYDETVDRLSDMAGSLKICDDEDLKQRGIRKIFMKRHGYVLLYRIGGDNKDIAYVEAVYHTLQDYENIFKRDVLDDIEE